MMIHPLMLYTGLVGFAVPFAFAFAALVTGELGTTWFRTTRRWTLFAWLFLSDRHHARRALGLRGARLGRLLGLGSGRERVVHAVARRPPPTCTR